MTTLIDICLAVLTIAALYAAFQGVRYALHCAYTKLCQRRGAAPFLVHGRVCVTHFRLYGNYTGIAQAVINPVTNGEAWGFYGSGRCWRRSETGEHVRDKDVVDALEAAQAKATSEYAKAISPIVEVLRTDKA